MRSIMLELAAAKLASIIPMISTADIFFSDCLLRPDYWILEDLAKKMPYDKADWQSVVDVCHAFVNQSPGYYFG